VLSVAPPDTATTFSGADSAARIEVHASMSPIVSVSSKLRVIELVIPQRIVTVVILFLV